MKIVHKSWQDNNKQVRTKRATLKNSPTLTISGGLMWTILYVENASLIDWHHCGDKRFRYPVPVERSPNLGMGNTIKDLKKVALKSKTLKEKIVSIRSSSTSTVGAFPQVVQLEEKFKEFYEMADANATLALETFGKRLDGNRLKEIVAILGGGSSADIKMKEIGERVFAEKLQEVKSIYTGLASTIENASVVFQWAFNRTMATMTLANWSFFLEAFTPKRWQSVRQNLSNMTAWNPHLLNTGILTAIYWHLDS